MRLRHEEVEAARAAIQGPDGLELLRYMRAVFFGTSNGASGSFARAAFDLDWIDAADGRRPRLTALGRAIADSAREYCYWLEDGRGLPTGLTPRDVAGKRVLDLGCGFGRYLWALNRCGAKAVGVDLDERYLQLSGIFAGREAAVHPRVIRAAGEELPFSDAQFDWVVCVVSLAYMDVSRALTEIARVLDDHGRCVLVGGTLGTQVRTALAGLTGRSSAASAFKKLLVVANSCLFQGIGRRLIPMNRARPTRSPAHVTASYLRRGLDRAGLTITHVDRKSSVFVATRRPR